MRLAALLSVLLLVVSTCQQAAHDHAAYGGARHSRVSNVSHEAPAPASDAGCPLCVALHGASPATAPALHFSSVIIAVVAAPVELRRAEMFWHFAGFSRPPPQTNS